MALCLPESGGNNSSSTAHAACQNSPNRIGTVGAPRTTNTSRSGRSTMHLGTHEPQTEYLHGRSSYVCSPDALPLDSFSVGKRPSRFLRIKTERGHVNSSELRERSSRLSIARSEVNCSTWRNPGGLSRTWQRSFLHTWTRLTTRPDSRTYLSSAKVPND